MQRERQREREREIEREIQRETAKQPHIQTERGRQRDCGRESYT